eukprot:COSAG01_NODE_966_length_12397_cov_146.646528_10_plen_76_part_00
MRPVLRRGSDDQGVSNVRRFLLEWLSFTHRYVPVGLMECPDLSTKINLREPGVSSWNRFMLTEITYVSRLFLSRH